MKVENIVKSIIDACGGVKLDHTCDILISGSYDTEVTGIVTTFMATVEVIMKTIELGANFIITHEPTYYTGLDKTEWIEDDPVYLKKKKLLDDHGIAVWRFHDHMHMAPTDLIYDGLLKEIGWQEYLVKGLPFPHCYEIPELTLKELSKMFKEKLEMDVVQIVGSPETKCNRIGILVGGGSLGLGTEEMPMILMKEQNLDVMVCGDITEWTLCPYVRDAATLGMNKAMLVLGHERTEEAGMKHMAKWLKPITKELPVHFVDAKEPFIYL